MLSAALTSDLGYRNMGRKLGQGSPIHLTFEVDDLGERIPVADPLPIIKFRFITQVHLHLFVRLVFINLQQKPLLLLADESGR